jgi:hypothetical protein
MNRNPTIAARPDEAVAERNTGHVTRKKDPVIEVEKTPPSTKT